MLAVGCHPPPSFPSCIPFMLPNKVHVHHLIDVQTLCLILFDWQASRHSGQDDLERVQGQSQPICCAGSAVHKHPTAPRGRTSFVSLSSSVLQDDFNGVVDGGMKVLVAALETRVGPSLKSITSIKWDAMEEVGEDTSAYMQGIVRAARKMMPELGEHLSGKYVTFFCTKFVSNFVPRLIGHIYRWTVGTLVVVIAMSTESLNRCARLQ